MRFDENEKKRRQLIDECIERGLPVLGDESIELLELFIKSDDEDDYLYYNEWTS